MKTILTLLIILLATNVAHAPPRTEFDCVETMFKQHWDGWEGYDNKTKKQLKRMYFLSKNKHLYFRD